jgi:hypothetical protein
MTTDQRLPAFGRWLLRLCPLGTRRPVASQAADNSDTLTNSSVVVVVAVVIVARAVSRYARHLQIAVNQPPRGGLSPSTCR